MKYYNNKTFILKGKKEITKDREKEIRDELIQKGYTNKTIKYDEFLNLYSRYKSELDEIQFAEIIGIRYPNYASFKIRKKDGAIILKTEEVDEEIIEKISNDNSIKNVYGKYINYDEFLNLYAPYSMYMTEIQFAQSIGISEANYGNIKRNNVKVEKYYSQKLRIKHIIRESRIYNIGEIQEFCDKYNITLNEFLSVVCNTEDIDIIREREEILLSKGLYIGSKPIDNDILDKYGHEIINFIDQKSRIIGSLYNQNRYCDDVTSDTIMYITQKRGDLFVNFDTKKALHIAKSIASKYIKYLYISKMRLKTISIDKLNEDLGDHHTYTRDKRQNVEDIVINKIKSEGKDIYEKCINLLKYYYEIGYANTEAIDKVALDLNIEKETMLEIMKKSLLERKKLKQTSNGDYYLGE